MAEDGTIKILVELVRDEAEKSLSGFRKAAEKALDGVASAAKISAEAIAVVGAGLMATGGAAVKVGSDFEAAMSRVQAISGATGEEFESLKEQAVSLGATTAFSAKEAAVGMENLASAGFETAEIIEAMPGMLDLAASSGEGLAASSDIAASTLRAFSMEASRAGHVADVLAKNAAATNAGVYDTGEAMKYVAPVAAAMGISFEECTAAIGIMSDNAIKGSQAGTTLRSAMSRMAKPTKDMRTVMDALGISFYDSEGNMKSLADQISILKEATSGLTNEQRDNYLSTLYGQEALSGMLALINTGDEKLRGLTDCYRECDGAAKDMAETMQDNLKAKVEQMQGAMESLGIAVYYDLAEPLKDAADKGTESIERIYGAFTNGGMEAAIREAGNVFAELAAEAAKAAPDMVKASVEFIRAFTNGIVKNKKDVISAAKEIVFALADGISELLPKKIRDPVKDAIKEIRKSIEDGGIKKSVETFTKFMGNAGKAVGEITKKALPAFVKILDFAAEHIDVLAAAVATCVTAYGSFNVVSSATTILNASKAAFTAASAAVAAYNAAVLAAAASGEACTATLTLGQAAVGLLTGKITLATAAQTAWNAVMNANPIGLVITAVAALAAGIAIYKMATEDVVTTEDMQAIKLQELSDKVTEQKDKWKELEHAKSDQVSADLAVIGRTQELWKELQTLVDENGKVKDGYEDRASFITGQLNDSLGLEIEMTDGVIQKYGELSQSIDAVMEKKKAQIILDANEAQYSEALQKIREAEMNQAEAKRALDEQQIATGQAENAYLQERNRIQQECIEQGREMERGEEARLGALMVAFSQEKAALAEKQQLYNDTEQIISGYYSSISEYETLAAAIASGNSAQMQAAIEAVTCSFQTATTSNASELAAQVLNLETHADLMKQKLEEKMPYVTQELVDQAAEMAVKAKDEYDKSLANFDEYTECVSGLMDNLTGNMSQDEAEQLAVWLGMVADAEVNGKAISDEAEEMANTVIDNLDKMPAQTREIMKNAMTPMMEEMEKSEPSLFEKASGIANGILSRLRGAFDIHSPSKKTRKIFRYVMDGAELGLSDKEGGLYSKTEDIAGNIMDKFRGLDIGAVMKKVEHSVFGMSDRFIPSAVMEKVSLSRVAAEVGGTYTPGSDIDYNQIGRAVKMALDGIKVEIDGKEAGEILSPYTDQNIGKEEKWRERL